MQYSYSIIFILKIKHFLAFSSQALLHKIEKIYNFSFCNKVFWAGLILFGRSWDWKHLIFYFRPSLMFCMFDFAMCVISVKTDDYMDSGTMEQLHVQLCNIATTTQLDLNTTTTAVTFHSSVSQPLHHDRIDLNLVVYSVA